MQVYHLDPLYAKTKSYTKEDRAAFSSEAVLAAIRIKRKVVATSSSPNMTTKAAFKHLLKNEVISLEDIVGIEHLVMGRSAARLPQDRKEHAQAVLREQMRHKRSLFKRNTSGMRQDDTTAEKLSDFSSVRTAKAVKRARIRAAMAA